MHDVMLVAGGISMSNLQKVSRAHFSEITKNEGNSKKEICRSWTNSASNFCKIVPDLAVASPTTLAHDARPQMSLEHPVKDGRRDNTTTPDLIPVVLDIRPAINAHSRARR
jgi:hypothetical protein